MINDNLLITARELETHCHTTYKLGKWTTSGQKLPGIQLLLNCHDWVWQHTTVLVFYRTNAGPSRL